MFVCDAMSSCQGGRGIAHLHTSLLMCSPLPLVHCALPWIVEALEWWDGPGCLLQVFLVQERHFVALDGVRQ